MKYIRRITNFLRYVDSTKIHLAEMNTKKYVSPALFYIGDSKYLNATRTVNFSFSAFATWRFDSVTHPSRSFIGRVCHTSDRV